jgi:nucleoside-diphosphate-sugar epimerase
MVNILITGATGFIGISLVKKLYELGHALKLLVRETSDISPFNKFKKILYIYGDVRDIESLSKAVEDVDIIYHLAAYTGIWAKDKSIYYDINVRGTENIAYLALKNNIRLFYISSFTALGPTLSEPVEENHENQNFCMEYEKSKFQAKTLVREITSKGLKVITFYPGIVYGPGDTNIFGKMLIDVMNGKILPLGLCPGKGESIACFSYIDDVVNGLISVIDREDLLGEHFILGGENIIFREYLDLIAEIARNKKAKKIPMKIAMLYAWALEMKANLTKKMPYLTRPTLNAIKHHRCYSSSKAIEKLGYKITPLREGLEKTIKSYQN